nr:uncharacterized protein LOC109737541 isoform X1 [Aegilops tauschii subsp. strangulata]
MLLQVNCDSRGRSISTGALASSLASQKILLPLKLPAMATVSGSSPAPLLTNHRLTIPLGDLQLGEVSNCSLRRSRPAACRACRCRRGPPHTVDAAATTPTTVCCRCVQPRPATHWTWAQRQGHAEGARAPPPAAASPAGCSGKIKNRSSKMKFEEGNMQQSKKCGSHYREGERLAIQPS